jgi:hypothetical protein
MTDANTDAPLSVLARVHPCFAEWSTRYRYHFWQDWIETLFGVDPDGGNGTAEWLIVLILLLLASVLAVRARLEWRRAQAVST